jgi:type II secretory pathway component PulC
VALLSGAASALPGAEISYDSGKRRDPFIPLPVEDSAAMSANSSGFKLEGIIYDPASRSVAILDGKAYQQGDDVGNAKIVKIFKDHVVISVEGEEKTLRMRIEEKT